MLALLQGRGTKILRFKGVLAMRGFDEEFVVQGMHMVFNGERGRRWESGKPRRSKLVFIGRRGALQGIEAGWKLCSAATQDRGLDAVEEALQEAGARQPQHEQSADDPQHADCKKLD
jgi:hypothetical protein